jgi:zinc protease
MKTLFQKSLKLLGQSLTIGSITSMVLACSTAQKSNNTSAFGSEGLTLPPFQERQLSNGLKVLYIKDTTLPKISITSLIKAGSVDDAANMRGLNYMTASLLDEGSEKHNSSELAERMEYLGGSLAINPGADFTTIVVGGLSFTKVELMDAFLEVLLTPKFPDSELTRIRKQLQNQIKKQQDDPDSYTDLMFTKMLFGQHPYGYPSYGTTKTLEKITRKDIINHYKQYYMPNNTQIAVVGDFDEAFERQFEAKLLTWLPGTAPKTTASTATKTLPAQIFFQGKKSLVQTQIRLGHLFVERNHPDFLKLRLANMALGGAFASRLNQVVRDDLGLTYGVHSFFDAKKQTGLFEINTFTRNDKVSETVQACQKVFKEFHEGGLKPEELKAAQSVVVGQFPHAVETMDALAFNMLVLRYYGIEDSYLTKFVSTINSYTLDQVNAVIKQHFSPENLQIVVFGEEKVADQLKKISKVQPVPANWQD